MTRQRAMLRAISAILAVTFFWTFAIDSSLGGLVRDFVSKEYLAPASQVERLSGLIEKIRDFIRRNPYFSTFSPERYAILLATFQDPERLLGIIDEVREYYKAEAKVPFPFKAWELFRVLYALERLGIQDGSKAIESFLESLTRRGDNFVSYIDAFSYLGIDEHMDYAKRLLGREDRNITDIELAQYHIGRVLGLLIEEKGNNAYREKLFKDAMSILTKAIDKDDLIGIFARDLARRDALIRYYEKGDLKSITLRAIELEQFGEFERGKLTVELLNPGEIEGTRYGYQDLQAIGQGALDEVAISIHAGGKGERYDTLSYDATGKRIYPNNDKGKAKGVYKLPVDNAASYIEITIRQVTGYNHEYNKKIPVIIYTSIFTNEEVCEELIARLGYHKPEKEETYSTYSIYRHDNRFMPEVRVVQCYTTYNFDTQTGDFVSHERLGIPVDEAVWSDAHDSSFIDLVASGTAYEMLNVGRRYVTITNVDNRAGILDPALLALIKLTGEALINELVKKPKGQKGGTAVCVRDSVLGDYPAMKRIVTGGRLVFLIEGFEFGGDDGPLWQELGEKAQEEAGKNGTTVDKEVDKLIEEYFPLFNTASYVVNIEKYVAQAFGVEESKVKDFLKKFFDARNDPEKSSRMRFELLESAYKFKMQSFEEEKRYKEKHEKTRDERYNVSAQRAANLAGDQTRVVNTLFVEVPEGKEAKESSRFEPQKEPLRNLIRLHRLYEYLKGRYGADTKLKDIRGELIDVLEKRAFKGPTLGDIVKQTAKNRKKGKWDIKELEEQTLGVIAETIREGILETLIPSIKRIGMKKGRKYPKGTDEVEDVIGDGLKEKIGKASDINKLGVETDKVYFLDTKWRARAQREYNGGVIGRVEDLFMREEYKGLLDWFESKGINSIAISGDIKDIVDEFFDVIIKVIERDGIKNLEEIINNLGIFNLYITQDDTGKRLAITSPVELRVVDAIKGLLKITGNTDRLTILEDEVTTFITANPKTETHYIRLDVDRLKESASLDYWTKMINRLSEYKTTKGEQLFQFSYFSSTGKDIGDFLSRNKLVNAQIPEGLDKTKIITIVDPADIKQEAEMGKNTLYLPMPYMRGTLSMAAEVVLSRGKADNFTPNVKGIISGLYKEILGRDITDNDIVELFTTPWKFLPEIKRVIEDLETMRRSIEMTEMAA